MSGTGAYENLVQMGLDPSVSEKLDHLIMDGYFPPEGYANEVADYFRGVDLSTLEEIITNYKQSDFSNITDYGSLLLQVAKSVWSKPAEAQPMMQQPPEYMKQDQPMDNQSYPGTAAPENNFSAPVAKTESSARYSGHVNERLQRILDRTGYKYEATGGQRSYGPGPGYEDFRPPKNCQCYFGKIPYEFEVEDLVELFEKAGTIYHMRLMMNPETGKNQTFGFVTFTNPQSAQTCVQMYDNFDCLIPHTNRKRKMVVKISEPNRRLFVGPVPKSKTKEDIMSAFASIVDGIEEVLINEPAEPGNTAKNKGFCFLDFVDHKSATQAKKRLDSGSIPIQAWRGFTGYGAQWADPLEEPDEETMSKVKNLYITKLTESVTEGDLTERFSQYGSIDRVKKVNNYAFVHFNERDDCMRALAAEDGKNLKDSIMKIALAKPAPPEGSRNQRGRGRGMRGGGMGDAGGFGRGRGGGMRNAPGGFGGRGGYGNDYGYAEDYGYEHYGGGASGYGGGHPSAMSGGYGYGYDQSRGYAGGYGSAGSYAYGGYDGGYGGNPYGAPSGYGGPPPGRGGGGYGGGRGGFQGDKRTFGGRGGPPPKRGRGGF